MKRLLPLFVIYLLSLTSAYAVGGAIALKHLEGVNSASKDNFAGDMITFDFVHSPSKNKITSAIDSSFRLFPSKEKFSFSISEAYLSFKDRSKVKSYSLGRKILGWNPTSKFFGIDSVDGFRSFELMDDKMEGLVGVHYNHKINNALNLNLIFSYLYLPQLSRTTTIEDGKIEGLSDIDTAHYESTVIMGKSVPLYYNLNEPETSDIVFQKTIGGNLKYKISDFFVSGYGIYKPENRFRFNATGYLDDDLKNVRVDITPFINYHFVYGGLVGHSFDNFLSTAGVEVIDPEENFIKNINSFDPIHISPNSKTVYTDYERISPSYQRQTYLYLSTNYAGKSMDTSLNYMKLVRLDSSSVGPSVFNNILFENAIGYSVGHRFYENFKVYLKQQYDLSRKDNLVNSEISYMNRNFAFKVGVKMLKVEDSESYWEDYKTHDSLYSELSYTY